MLETIYPIYIHCQWDDSINKSSRMNIFIHVMKILSREQNEQAGLAQ